MNYKRLSLALSIAIVAGAIFLIFKRYRHAPAAASYPDLLNKGRCATFAGLSIDTSDEVFVGDSQTEKFPLTEMANSLRIKNRGIGQNTSAHILGRIGPIIDARPAKIFLQMGLNDFAQGVTVDSLFKNYQIVVNKIITRSPSTKLYIQSISPVSNWSGDARSEVSIEKLNQRLRGLCNHYNLTFIDIFPDLFKNGGLNEVLTWDGIHLNYQGYQIWYSRLLPYL